MKLVFVCFIIVGWVVISLMTTGSVDSIYGLIGILAGSIGGILVGIHIERDKK